jgi:hypothetical protein
LHCATLFSEQFPAAPGHQLGDVGGNLLVLKIEGRSTRLHSYWDELPGDLSGGVMVNTPDHEKKLYAMVKQNTERFRDPEAFGKDKFPQLMQKEFQGWADESFKLAKDVAYMDGDKVLQGVRVNFGATLPANPPFAASDDYVKNARTNADKQVVLAGFRLTDLLTALLGG